MGRDKPINAYQSLGPLHLEVPGDSQTNIHRVHNTHMIAQPETLPLVTTSANPTPVSGHLPTCPHWRKRRRRKKGQSHSRSVVSGVRIVLMSESRAGSGRNQRPKNKGRGESEG